MAQFVKHVSSAEAEEESRRETEAAMKELMELREHNPEQFDGCVHMTGKQKRKKKTSITMKRPKILKKKQDKRNQPQGKKEQPLVPPLPIATSQEKTEEEEDDSMILLAQARPINNSMIFTADTDAMLTGRRPEGAFEISETPVNKHLDGARSIETKTIKQVETPVQKWVDSGERPPVCSPVPAEKLKKAVLEKDNTPAEKWVGDFPRPPVCSPAPAKKQLEGRKKRHRGDGEEAIRPPVCSPLKEQHILKGSHKPSHERVPSDIVNESMYSPISPHSEQAIVTPKGTVRVNTSQDFENIPLQGSSTCVMNKKSKRKLMTAKSLEKDMDKASKRQASA